MFTGIIERVCLVRECMPSERGIRFRIGYENVQNPLCLGESVAINGCCLTVAEIDKNSFLVEAVKETLQATTLGGIKAGDSVNIERSLKVGDRIGGHFVCGHVDGVGTIQKAVRSADHYLILVDYPKSCENYIAEKGSVTVDGVSLTIQQVVDRMFAFALIPYTAQATTLGMRKEGDRVNIEADILARYAQGHTHPKSEFPFTVDDLKEQGF